ncbi:protein ALP1-like isoform X2 [Athalia rosae]|uniref:protein ALP1-like isoform X2 n=1 Tax=Athalia rosae TaxID=37344 RepID=UPI0020341EE9|nr:protein ALP1-like isoform X2 [Athalia rosae]XP_048513984.1 protein ALP1-like isoform X2 [Athalia rosae]
MDRETFRCHFRLTVQTFEVVLDKVSIALRAGARNVNNGRSSIPPEKSLLLTLWLLATPDSFRSVADRFGTTKSVAHRNFLQITKILSQLAAEYLRWPTIPELRRVRILFDNLRPDNGFPDIIGAVDGTHIAIRAPIIDPKSSSHDSRVWRRSPICQQIEENEIIPEGTHLVGDSAYPLHKYLMTPYKDNGHLTRRQKNYNYELSSKRVVIEQAFGRLKGRFRRLKYLDMALMNKIKTVVIAACVLHNMCIKCNDPWEEEMPVEPDNNVDDGANDGVNHNEDARTKRDNIARMLETL